MNETTSTPDPQTPKDNRIKAKENLRKTARQFWAITRAFFKSERRGKARGLLILLVTLSVAYISVVVLISYAGRDFITAIEKKIRRPTGTRWAATSPPSPPPSSSMSSTAGRSRRSDCCGASG